MRVFRSEKSGRRRPRCGKRIDSMKALILMLGFFTAAMLIVRVVMGVLVRNNDVSPRSAHILSGSLMVLAGLAGVALSLTVIFSRPKAG